MADSKVKTFLDGLGVESSGGLKRLPSLYRAVEKGEVLYDEKDKCVYYQTKENNINDIRFRLATGADFEYSANKGNSEGTLGTITLTIISRLSGVPVTELEKYPVKLIRVAGELVGFLLTDV